MAMSESTLQMMLAQDQGFLKRLAYAMVIQARVVQGEDPATPGHAQRAQYAQAVVNSPQQYANGASTMVVGGPNVQGTVTLEDAGVTTTVSDAALYSQVSSFWNNLAGVTAPAA